MRSSTTSSATKKSSPVQSNSLPPRMNDLIDDEREHLLTNDALHTLADVLATVPDPRSYHGRRHDLPLLLTWPVVAMLCNCNPLEAVGH
jgi:hypothetical protein